MDRSRCIPWKGDSQCIVCEEHCPTHDKAIKLNKKKVDYRRQRAMALQKNRQYDAAVKAWERTIANWRTKSGS